MLRQLLSCCSCCSNGRIYSTATEEAPLLEFKKKESKKRRHPSPLVHTQSIILLFVEDVGYIGAWG